VATEWPSGHKDFTTESSLILLPCSAAMGTTAVIHLRLHRTTMISLTRLLPNNIVGLYNAEAARAAG
jgi:hypothetical protein